MRVFLLNPPSSEPVQTPLLSFCHLAASLRAGGHEVALYDAAAPFAPDDDASIVARLEAFRPEIVGFHLKTLHVQPAYALAQRLGDRWPLVAGGPHATIRPDEALARGFNYVVRGEGEETLPALCSALAAGGRLDEIAGLSWRERGLLRHTASAGFIRELDALASPMSALGLFDPAWYGRDVVTLPPAGLLASRGCPAACNFCSNDVTGRQYRYRAPSAICDDVRHLRDRLGVPAFSFFDDSFAVGRRRMHALCAALAEVVAESPVWWSCTAHPAHLDRDILVEMRAAGCSGIDIGMESGDPGMLRRIGKGVTVERVADVVGWCAEVGIHVVVNLMFGWPDETEAELDATVDFMERIAMVAGGFNARGVVVPYPATGVYEDHHARFGFSDWWLREPPLDYPAFPTRWDEDEIRRAYASDPALGRNFFRHSDGFLRRVEAALARKAELTLSVSARRRAADRLEAADRGAGVPAAGAR